MFVNYTCIIEDNSVLSPYSWISKQTGYERESESVQEGAELNYKSEAERTFLRFTGDGRKRFF